MTRTLQFIGLAAALFLTALAVILLQNASQVQGSVSVSDEYHATSTAANTANDYGIIINSDRIIKTGPGSIGSIVITGAAAGTISLYNATTSDVTKRTGQKATSTILLAHTPASLAAGTYTFDVEFTDGLWLELGGTAPTSTITYR